ncbi:uncharacterized protein DFL_000718 [Arthrobotrys flagrans]|uniref:Uncharacterized protein n=1 Tax=Arthrobotrys flagrans TaxID=97331 RepID=A0A437AEJ4_ARTFL|nr:hypothetical protein DFL_000718 [Arthrobotrys flagrans]
MSNTNLTTVLPTAIVYGSVIRPTYAATIAHACTIQDPRERMDYVTLRKRLTLLVDRVHDGIEALVASIENEGWEQAYESREAFIEDWNDWLGIAQTVRKKRDNRQEALDNVRKNWGLEVSEILIAAYPMGQPCVLSPAGSIATSAVVRELGDSPSPPPFAHQLTNDELNSMGCYLDDNSILSPLVGGAECKRVTEVFTPAIIPAPTSFYEPMNPYHNKLVKARRLANGDNLKKAQCTCVSKAARRLAKRLRPRVDATDIKRQMTLLNEYWNLEHAQPRLSAEDKASTYDVCWLHATRVANILGLHRKGLKRMDLDYRFKVVLQHRFNLGYLKTHKNYYHWFWKSYAPPNLMITWADLNIGLSHLRHSRPITLPSSIM